MSDEMIPLRLPPQDWAAVIAAVWARVLLDPAQLHTVVRVAARLSVAYAAAVGVDPAEVADCLIALPLSLRQQVVVVGEADRG